MSLELGKLSYEIDADTSAFDKALDGASRKVQSFDKAVEKSSSKKIDVTPTGTGKLDAAAKSADGLGKAAERAANSAGRITVPSSVVSSLTNGAGAAGELAAELDRASASASKLSSSSGGAGELSSVLGKVATTAKGLVPAITAASAATAVFSKGWSRFTAIDDAQFKLKGLGHTAQGVADIMESSMASVKGTSFGLGEAASAAASAVASGIKPGQELTRVLTTAADTAAIAGASMGDMGMIFNSIAARGKLQGDDLLQLLSRGVPVLQLLSQQLGVTAADVSEMVSEGKIDFATFEAAMREGMGGAAKEMGNSITGSISNVQAALGRLGEAIISPVMQEGPEVISGLTDGIDVLTEAVKTTVGVWEKVPGPIKTVIAALVAAKVATATLGPLMGTQLAGSVSKVTNAFAAGAKGFTTFGSSLKEAYSYARVANPEMGRFGASMTVLAGQGGVAATAMGGLKGAAGGLMAALGGPWGLAIAGASTALGLFMNHIQQTKADQEAAAQATQSWADAWQDAGGKINSAIQDQALKSIQDSGMAEQMDRLKVSYADASAAVLDLNGSYDDMVGQLDKIIQAGTDYDSVWAKMSAHGYIMDDDAKAAQELKDKLAELHGQQEAGADAAQKAADGQSELARQVAEAARQTEDAPGKYDSLNAILATLSGEAKNADEAIKNMANAMMSLSDDPAVSLQGYLGESAAAIQQLGEQLKSGLGGLDDSGLFDEWDAQGRQLAGTMSDVRANLFEAASAAYELSLAQGQTGVQAAESAAQAAQEHVDALRTEMEAAGLTQEQIQGLIDRYGLVPQEIMTEIKTAGAETATQLMDGIDERLARVDAESATITVDSSALNLTEEQLTALGFKVEDLGNNSVQITADTDLAKEAIDEMARLTENLGTADNTIVFRADQQDLVDGLNEIKGMKSYVEENPARMRLLADTEESRAAIEELGVEVQSLPNGYLWVDDNSPDVMTNLSNLGANVAALPEGNVVIYDTSAENLAALDALGVKTTTLPDGRVVITDNAAETRENINRELSKSTLNKIGTVTMNIVRNIRDVFSSGHADGGRLPGHYTGGQLPRNARGNVARHNGYRLPTIGPGTNVTDGILGMTPDGIPVSWLDAGEWITNADASAQYDRTLGAMNSGAPARVILASLLSELPKNADGGKSAQVIDQLSPYNNGPYTMGGFSPSTMDCSGAVSATVNTWLGLDPFESRMSTVTEGSWLAAKGFEYGKGNGRELVVGWYDYGGGANGHTAMMLPDGTYIESGGNTGQGFTIGGAAGPLEGRGFTHFMYLPGSDEEENGDELTGDGGVTIGGNGTPIEDIKDVASVSGGSRASRASFTPISAPSGAGYFDAPGFASNRPGGSVRSSLGGARSNQLKALADQYGFGAQADALLNMGNPFQGQYSWREELGEPTARQLESLASQLENTLGRGGIKDQVTAALSASTPNWDVWLRVNDETIEAFNNLGKAKADRENAALDVTEAEEKLAEARKNSTEADEEAAEKLAEAYKALDKARQTKNTKNDPNKQAEAVEKAEKKIQELREKAGKNGIKSAENIAKAQQDLVEAREAEAKAVEAQELAQKQYNAALAAAPLKAAAAFVDVIATSMGKLGESLAVMAQNLDHVNSLVDAQIDAENSAASAKLNLIQKEADFRKLQRDHNDAQHSEVLAIQQAEFDLAVARHNHQVNFGNAEIDLANLRQNGILNVAQTVTETDRNAIISAVGVQVAETSLAQARATAQKNDFDRYVALEQATYELNYQQELAKIENERLALATNALASAASRAASILGSSASALAKEQEGNQKKASGVGKILGGLASGAAAAAMFSTGAGIPAALGLAVPAVSGIVSGVSELLSGKAQADAYKKEAKKEYDALSEKNKRLVDTSRAGLVAGALAGAGVGMAGGTAADVGTTVQSVANAFNIPIEYEMNKQKYGYEAADLIRSKQEAELNRRQKRAELEKTRKQIALAEATGGRSDQLDQILRTLNQQLAEQKQERTQLGTKLDGVNDKLEDKNRSVLMTIGGSGWGVNSKDGMMLTAATGGFGGITADEVGKWSSIGVENGWLNTAKARPLVEYSTSDGNGSTTSTSTSSRISITGLPDTVADGVYASRMGRTPQASGAVEAALQSVKAASTAQLEELKTTNSSLSSILDRLMPAVGGATSSSTIGTQFTGPVTINGRDADDTLSSLRRELAQR